MPFTLLDQGTFESDGFERDINLPGSADYFVLSNMTEMGTANNVVIRSEWFQSVPAGDAILWTRSATGVGLGPVTVPGTGFLYRESRPDPEGPVIGTAITAANPAEVTANAHGYIDGDRVRLTGTTGMTQIAGMDFTVSNATANTFELAGLDASGFAAPATALVARRLPPIAEVTPESLYVTGVSQALGAVVQLSTLHSYQVDQLLRMSVPKEFGMTQMDGLTGRVLAVTPFSVTLDIDSSGFFAFAFRPSAPGAPEPKDFASIAPAGQRNAYNVDQVPFKTGQFYPYMHLGSEVVGSASDMMVYQAWKAE